jgi:hypothetical protein
VYTLNAEELNEHIRNNIDDTDFCSVCKRWSFIYNADVNYYDESVVMSIDSHICRQIQLYGYSINGWFEE